MHTSMMVSGHSLQKNRDEYKTIRFPFVQCQDSSLGLYIEWKQTALLHIVWMYFQPNTATIMLILTAVLGVWGGGDPPHLPKSNPLPLDGSASVDTWSTACRLTIFTDVKQTPSANDKTRWRVIEWDGVLVCRRSKWSYIVWRSSRHRTVVVIESSCSTETRTHLCRILSVARSRRRRLSPAARRCSLSSSSPITVELTPASCFDTRWSAVNEMRLSSMRTPVILGTEQVRKDAFTLVCRYDVPVETCHEIYTDFCCYWRCYSNFIFT